MGAQSLAVVPDIQVASWRDIPSYEVMAEVITKGNLADLSPAGRVEYYNLVCSTTGLNPATLPFLYLELDKKHVLYATKNCAEQLRRLYGISIQIVDRRKEGDVYIVTSQASTSSGQRDESIGAVPLLKPDGAWKTSQNGKRYFEPNGKMLPLTLEEYANAIMKAETKSKRRVSLSICSLGMMDESEIDTVRNARRVNVDFKTGEIVAVEPRSTMEEADPRSLTAATPTTSHPPTSQQQAPKATEQAIAQLRSDAFQLKVDEADLKKIAWIHGYPSFADLDGKGIHTIRKLIERKSDAEISEIVTNARDAWDEQDMAKGAESAAVGDPDEFGEPTQEELI